MALFDKVKRELGVAYEKLLANGAAIVEVIGLDGDAPAEVASGARAADRREPREPGLAAHRRVAG